MKIRLLLTLLILSYMQLYAGDSDLRQSTLTILQTTDVHGNFFPYDFIKREPAAGSLARVAAYTRHLRDSLGNDRVILLENGDILQGQPTAYYYNFIDTLSPHIAAEMINFMGYDAATIGNHDVETGHAVYDRWASQLAMPLLAANVVDAVSGKPYFKPYTVIERNGLRVAVLGLLTPAIPAWLPENLWAGLRFEDMVDSARKWVPEIISKERPDLLIGLFHAGKDEETMTGEYRENASLLAAREVPGFDAVMFGHDHTCYAAEIMTDDGHRVVAVNPANNARAVGRIDVTVVKDGDGNVVDKRIKGSVVNLDHIKPDPLFEARFAPQRAATDSFVNRPVGRATGEFSTRDAFTGPSAFMSLLHDLQLEISGADISFAAPLSFDAVIAAGPVMMSDMFKLYKYENMLYTMRLTGREIKGYLEESYALWTKQVETGDESVLLFADGKAAKGDYAKLRNPSYNFDSAAGIDYTVDVTKPAGSKITITGMSDVRKFCLDSVYEVAVNSYRGNGGGDLLLKGAGIPADELKNRIVRSTDKDLRYYLMQAIERRGTITPSAATNWRFIPEEIARPALERDRRKLFGE